jgi:hypothetical protein
VTGTFAGSLTAYSWCRLGVTIPILWFFRPAYRPLIRKRQCWQGYQDPSLKRRSQSPLCCQLHHTPTKMVSVARIELALHGPKPRVMPFHYTEKNWSGYRETISGLMLGKHLRFQLRHIRKILVDRKRIELLPSPCKGDVLPLSLTAH